MKKPESQKKLSEVKKNFIKLEQLKELRPEDFLKTKVDFSGSGGGNKRHIGKNQDLDKMRETAKRHLDKSVSEYFKQCEKEKIKAIDLNKFLENINIPPYKFPDRLTLLRRYIKRKRQEIENIEHKFRQKEDNLKRKEKIYKEKIKKGIPVSPKDNPKMGRKLISIDEARERLENQIMQANEEIEEIRSKMSELERLEDDLKVLKNDRISLIPKRINGKNGETKEQYNERLRIAKEQNKDKNDEYLRLIAEKEQEIKEYKKRKNGATPAATAAVVEESSHCYLFKLDISAYNELNEMFDKQHSEAVAGGYDAELSGIYDEIKEYNKELREMLDKIATAQKNYILKARLKAKKIELERELGI